MREISRFQNKLEVRVSSSDELTTPFNQTWETLSPFTYITNIPPKDEDSVDRILVRPYAGVSGQWEIRVPVGLVTDFASIPRVFWSIIPKTGRWSYAAVIHDFLTDYAIDSEEWAALVLREAADESFCGWRREALYWGVRIGGKSSWLSGKYRKTTRFTLNGYPLYTPVP